MELIRISGQKTSIMLRVLCLLVFITAFGNYLRAQATVGAEHAVKTQKMKSGWRNERAQAADEVQRMKNDRGGAVLPGLVQCIEQFAITMFWQALTLDRWPTEVTAQAQACPLLSAAMARSAYTPRPCTSARAGPA